MFHQARIKLTAWYLIIIMAISLSFSVAIYLGVNRELVRIEDLQNIRNQRNQLLTPLIEELSQERVQNGLPPPQIPQTSDVENIQEVRLRILEILGLINFSILILAGGGGYLLAGQTLDPIAEMVDEQKEFIGNASHELRTPLTSLKTEIEVALRDKRLSLEQAKKLLSSNLEDVNEMQELSNYLLNLNRYERGSDLEFSNVNLKDVMATAIEKTSAIATQKNITVKLAAKNTIVKGNGASLIELATILLENAIKYSPKGKSIDVHIKGGKTIEISDHGLGIAEKDIPHIFERFYRADTSRSKEKIDGYGLGLSIAKSIVDLHNGKIEVESKPGKGSKFTVTL